MVKMKNFVMGFFITINFFKKSASLLIKLVGECDIDLQLYGLTNTSLN